MLYSRDGKLKVDRGPIFKKLKSSRSEHGEQKKKKRHGIYFVYNVN